MQRFGALMVRELMSYFNSAVAYVSLTAFLFLSGLSFAINMFGYAERGVPASHYDTMHVVSFLTMLVAPLITMRLLAEEKSRGTLETLMTAPVRDLEVVLAKFASALVFFAFLVAPTLVLVAMLARFGAADGGAIFTAYLGMLLMSAALFSIGLFISALSSSQMVAGFVTLVVALLLTFLQLATYVVRDDTAVWRIVAQQINLVENSLPFLQGVLDTRPLVFFVSVCALLLFATSGVVGARRWVDPRKTLPIFLLTIGLLAANLVVVNRISFRNFVRLDMTASKKFSLDPRT
ncbi:MAG TPA: ABC transporter permease, partial [Planctomycetota bacterium]|nr:ABC transporter permease [Planctomycetota bacterium]